MSKIVEIAAAVLENLEDVLINIGKIRKEQPRLLPYVFPTHSVTYHFIFSIFLSIINGIGALFSAY